MNTVTEVAAVKCYNSNRSLRPCRIIQWDSWNLFHLETYELGLKLRPVQSKPDGAGGGGGGGGGERVEGFNRQALQKWPDGC